MGYMPVQRALRGSLKDRQQRTILSQPYGDSLAATTAITHISSPRTLKISKTSEKCMGSSC